MRVALFCHSLLSDYAHGSAHFLRGVVTELGARRHEVRVLEPRDAESVRSLIGARGEKALDRTRQAYPRLRPRRYDPATLDLDEVLDGIDLALVHHSTEPELVRQIGERRSRGGARFRVLFHDARPGAIATGGARGAGLAGFDGVLAGAASIRGDYARAGRSAGVWIWHEAADPRVFYPQPAAPRAKRGDVTWVANWGPGRRVSDLRDHVLEPIRELRLSGHVYGVGYPDDVIAELQSAGLVPSGYVPNFELPEVLACAKIALHLPPRREEGAPPAAPAMGCFEALACGIPLVSTPWDDVEGLFSAGRDYLVAEDAAAMRRHLRRLADDASARSELSRNGRRTILARHTCAHRVDELLGIAGELGVRVRRPAVQEGAFT